MATSASSPTPPNQAAAPVPAKQSSFSALLRSYPYLFVIGEVAVIGALGYWLLIRPSWAEVARLDAAADTAVRDAQSRLDAATREVGVLQSVIDGYRTLSEGQTAAIHTLLPDGMRLEQLFAQLDAIVKSNGVLLSAIEVDEEIADEPADRRGRFSLTERAPAARVAPELARVSFSFTIAGVSYPALRSVVSGLETALRLIDVDAVTYEPATETATLHVVAYYRASAQK